MVEDSGRRTAAALDAEKVDRDEGQAGSGVGGSSEEHHKGLVGVEVDMVTKRIEEQLVVDRDRPPT